MARRAVMRRVTTYFAYTNLFFTRLSSIKREPDRTARPEEESKLVEAKRQQKDDLDRQSCPSTLRVQYYLRGVR